MVTRDVQYAPKIEASFSEKSVRDLSLSFRHGHLNLEPGFQRRSVWSTADRRRLIQSLISNYPVPSIFLYERNSRGKTIYDVLDGKQRLETILMFTRQGRFKRDAFEVRLDLGDGYDWYDWRALSKNSDLRHSLETYKIPTVEVRGELAEIVDLFVRINSTGKPLTSGEKRHAKFFNSPFLREAEKLVVRFRPYLLSARVLTDGQLERMKGTELFSELLMSIHQGGLINKKTALDRAIGNDAINGNTLHRLGRELTGALNTVRRTFPDLATLRFHNSAEFYSLVMLVWEMRHLEFILTDRKRNEIAGRLLRRLSTGVDELRDRLRKAQPAAGGQRLYADYLLTVQGDTDSAASRTRRREILSGLLFSLFEFKDEKRIFTPEQRRILWNSEERKLCRICKKELKWSDVAADHILAHAKGGRTRLDNAQLAHRTCNSRKGAR
ncbi:MAG: HNH endonuclease family protein [Polyangiaceae bacterium]